MRIEGVNPKLANALNLIGVDSLKEFAYRNPKNTVEKLKILKKDNPKIDTKIPTLTIIEGLIKTAKKIAEIPPKDDKVKKKPSPKKKPAPDIPRTPNYEPFEKQCISIYTKHGNFVESNLYNLGHIYGVKTSVKQSDDFDFSLLYEFTQYKRRTTMPLSSSVTKIKKSHKIDGSIDYKLPTNHVLKLKAKFNPMKFSTKTSEIALSYSIPYDVPWPKKNN